MDKPSPGPFLADKLLEIDEAKNARPKVAQQPSDIAKERDARLASQMEKIAALRRDREAGLATQPAPGVLMPKRELIDTGTDKRYVRRNKQGTSFVESDDVGRSLAADRRQQAKTKVKSGQGDKGDRPRPKAKQKAAAKRRTKAASRKSTARKSASKARAKRN